MRQLGNKINEVRFYEKEHITHRALTESFLQLPRKCQEMFFEFMECGQMEEGNTYFPFLITGFDFEFCKSPIEKILLMAFNVLTNSGVLEYNFLLSEQVEIKAGDKRYIADFVFDTEGDNQDFFWFENKLKLIIECDGHEYHKVTKEQVKHDNERDLALKMVGYDVLHFSGSQIYNEPWKCADVLYSYIMAKVGHVDLHLPYQTRTDGDVDAKQNT